MLKTASSIYSKTLLPTCPLRTQPPYVSSKIQIQKTKRAKMQIRIASQDPPIQPTPQLRQSHRAHP